jgi:hypothetical protein
MGVLLILAAQSSLCPAPRNPRLQGCRGLPECILILRQEGTESLLQGYWGAGSQGCTQLLEHLKFFRRGNETDIGQPRAETFDTMIARARESRHSCYALDYRQMN